MRSILYFLAAICLLVPAPVTGASGDEATLGGITTDDNVDSSDQSLIVTVQPDDYGQMVEYEFDEGTDLINGSSQMPSNDFNALWVVGDNEEMNDSLSVPLGNYARVFITPSQGGNVVVEQLNPDDQLQTIDVGMVEPFHTYGIWFYADALGTHQMRYSVNGSDYSDVGRVLCGQSTRRSPRIHLRVVRLDVTILLFSSLTIFTITLHYPITSLN